MKFLFSVFGNASARTAYDLEECLKSYLSKYNDDRTALSTGTNLDTYQVEVHSTTIDRDLSQDE